MSLLSLFSAVVFAAELIISPIPPGEDSVIRKPITTFGMLTDRKGTVLSAETSATASSDTISSADPLSTDPETGSTLTPTITHVSGGSVAIRSTGKDSYTIAVLGDSMVDTLGPDIPHLQAKLDQVFPYTNFTLLNYGVGATNIEYGLNRITNDYSYLDKPIPSLVSQHPDIVVVESFGYNPFPFETGALDKHWLTMGTITDTLKNQIPGVKIIVAATIAPHSDSFGDGAPGVSFDPEFKKNHTSNIKKYIRSAINFAGSQHYPLADAFTPSLTSDGEGNPLFINPGDHIHPSDAGKALFAEKIVAALVDNRLLE